MMLVVAGAAACFAMISGIARWGLTNGPPMRAHCMNNMKCVALALLGYHQITGSFPSGTVPNLNLRPEQRLGFYAQITHHLDAQELYDQTNPAQPWDSLPNLEVARTGIGLLNCLLSPPVVGNIPQPTNYIGIAGVGKDAPYLPKTDPSAGVFGYDRKTTIADIKDGTSSTMLLGESSRVIGSWLQGGPATVRGLDPTKAPYIGPGRQFGGLHDGVAIIAMADGSVRAVSESINPKFFEAMSTIAGGERLPLDWMEPPAP
jgi:Protein of unknown function (DUF1559)